MVMEEPPHLLIKELDMQQVLAEVASTVHLQREKALRTIECMLKEKSEIQNADRTKCMRTEELQVAIDKLCQGERWEERLGGLQIAKLLVQYGDMENLPSFGTHICQDHCMALLEDSEVRVRWAVAELLGSLSKESDRIFQQQGTCIVWDLTGNQIIDSIQRNYNRDDGTAEEEQGKDGDTIGLLLQQSYKVVRPGKGEMRHDTEGWKCLETSFRALDSIMKGYGTTFHSYLDRDMLGLISSSLRHPNRFVREVCQFILGTICDILSEEELLEIHTDISSKIGFGLSDNWSQVRYAASVAVRKFVLATQNHKDIILPLILPQMCLNRYYVAEGVRLYSQETWKIAVGTHGREWVAKCITNVVSYYVEQSKANNHAVREASCSCIAELMAKIDRQAVSPHVPRLLSCLLTCFRDASWPVRDAACLATGRCVLSFPEESREILEKLYKLWFTHLEENIFSVREDSAVALGNAARAYGEEAIHRIEEKLKEMLPKAKDQIPESTSLSKLENVTSFGVAAERMNRANDKTMHTDQLMFSCGSLAPKLKRGADCCGDYGMSRPAEAWEASDGSIYLIRELAVVSPESVIPFMSTLAELGELTHFTHHVILHETLWKCLPDIASSLGKAEFKKHLEAFLPALFRDLECGHQLCEVSAEKCVSKLKTLIGPGIFLGRLTDDQKRIFERLQYNFL